MLTQSLQEHIHTKVDQPFRGHLQCDFKSYCRGDYSRTCQGRAITRYASFVAFNKAYSTDVNKRVHCVRAGQFKTAPRHTRDDCKLGG